MRKRTRLPHTGNPAGRAPVYTLCSALPASPTSSPAAVPSSIRHEWPLLGRELFTMEQLLLDPLDGTILTPEKKAEKQAQIRETVIAQLYRDEEKYSLDLRHCALLLLKKGRGGEIVGNPFCLDKGGIRQELPYTGLEGYYAGSERTRQRPGLSREEILLEEATIGADLLSSLKKHHVAHNSWASLVNLEHVLVGAKPDMEDLRAIDVLWAAVVRKLHTRVYHHPDYEMTLTERLEHLEQLLGSTPGRTPEAQAIRAEYERLLHEKQAMSGEEHEQETQERSRRQWIRRDRWRAYQRFREETYQLLKAAGNHEYDVRIQDGSLEDANIIETITLPAIPGRETYPPTQVVFTLAQLEGYLFLARLGDIGGDPLMRSVLLAA